MIEQKLISDLKRPKGVQYDVDKNDQHHGIFSAKPYVRGFGTTVANSLRRTLLAAVPGYAVIAVRFDGINNEFQNIEGVYEDTSVIIANLKNVAVTIKGSEVESKTLHYEVKGKTVFKASDLVKDETIAVGNPDFVIFKTNKNADFSFDIEIRWGRGYVSSEEFEKSVEKEGVIPIDGNFSPIDSVSFTVDSVRIGNRSDFEKIVLDIKTRGTLMPEDALKQAAQILKESYLTFNDIETEEEITKAIDDKKVSESRGEDQIFSESVFTLDLTVRTNFFLKVNDIREVGQVVMHTKSELKGKPHCHDAIIDDLEEKLSRKNLSLGMKEINYTPKQMI